MAAGSQAAASWKLGGGTGITSSVPPHKDSRAKQLALNCCGAAALRTILCCVLIEEMYLSGGGGGVCVSEMHTLTHTVYSVT